MSSSCQAIVGSIQTIITDGAGFLDGEALLDGEAPLDGSSRLDGARRLTGTRRLTGKTGVPLRVAVVVAFVLLTRIGYAQAGCDGVWVLDPEDRHSQARDGAKAVR